MTEQQAQNAVTFSALIVGGIFLVRKFAEPKVPTSSNRKGKVAQLAGAGPLPSTSRFVVGWGFVFVVLSALAQGNPDIGGRMAVLVTLGDVLTNWSAVAKDLNVKLSQPKSTAGQTPALVSDFQTLDSTAGLYGPDAPGGITTAEDIGSEFDRIARLQRLARTGKLSKADKADPLAPFIAGGSAQNGRPFAKLTIDQLQEQIAELSATQVVPFSTAGSAPTDVVPADQGSF